jgi:hypothetical protein
MEITRLPRKPLDNPPRPKRAYASDAELAGRLAAVLARVPDELSRVHGSTFPLLEGLIRVDGLDGTDLAPQLLFVAATTHRTADERRIAEYLLRNRGRLAGGEASALGLIGAARCAAEMDVRRVQTREIPVPPIDLTVCAASRRVRSDYPSVGEMVIHKLRIATGGSLGLVVAERILDAVPIALELAERHGLNGGTGPSLVGMRCDARPQSRLVTHLRAAFGNAVAARNIARLLVGADGTSIDTALLWWCTRPNLTASDVPLDIRTRWTRYLRSAQAAVHTAESYPQVCETRHHRAACSFESRISDERREVRANPRRAALRPCGGLAMTDRHVATRQAAR